MRLCSRLLRRIGLTALASVCAIAPARGQSGDRTTTSSAAQTSGGFDLQGSIGIGYRMTDVTGDDAQYQELFNLGGGWRLPDMTLIGRAPKGRDLFADAFSISASGLGGDPYQTVQVTARKNGLYDLRAAFRRSDFFWDDTDAALPAETSALASHHAWNTARQLGSIDLLLHATAGLRLAFEFDHSALDGLDLTTRSLDFFGSPSAWGSFTRANPYSMLAPTHEMMDRYATGFDYTRSRWNAHYRAGYQIFDDAVTANALTTPEASIDTIDPATANELLSQGSYQDYRRLSTPLSEFSYNGTIAPTLTWRGGYLFYRYTGPAALQAAYDGDARANASGSIVAPYTLALDTRSNVTEPMHVVDQGLTWNASDRITMLTDYRYEWIGIDSAADFTTLFDGTPGTGESTGQWRERRHQIDVDLEFMPVRAMLVRVGVRDLHEDIRVLSDGVLDDLAATRSNTVWPTVSMSWKPDTVLDVHADVDSMTNDAPYTRLTPQTDVGSHVVLHVRPSDALSIVDAVTVRHQALDAADYVADARGNALTLHYQINSHLALFGGYTIDRMNATGSTSFLRGPTPLDDTIIDDTTDNVWQGGLSANLGARLSVNVAGNYIRTTGEGTITGEPPTSGPLRYPYATGTISYAFPAIGRLSVDVERADYTDMLIPLNDFHARIVMLRWTRAF